MKAKQPEPLIISDLSHVFIFSASNAKFDKLTFEPSKGCEVTSQWPAVSQFDDVSLAVRTGPYKLGARLSPELR
jgi:peptide/nickel transport system substrate-binding protein